MPPLAAALVAASDRPSRQLVMLHGVYGRGRNWQAIARALVGERPEYGCWLVDLPHHGDSPPGRHGDSVHGLARDVADWCADQGRGVDAVLGHSFGGKVALAFAAASTEQRLQIWMIDSTPGNGEPSGSAWQMLSVIRALPGRFATRDEAVAGLVRGGVAEPVAQWMATNLVRTGDGFVWRLDFHAMERLLRDFYGTDLWAVVEDPAPQHELHVLKASESSVISPAAAQRLVAARVHVHERQGGHWIHAESPNVVVALLSEHLP